jgi:HlyD family secretion protein
VSALACGKDEAPGTITASGHVEATEVRVATKVAGSVDVLPVQEGDRVAADQEIARIDTTSARIALSGARAERDQAAAALRLHRAGSRREDVGEAQAQLARAQAELTGAQRELERMEALFASGSGTDKSRDDARTRRDQATAAVEAARERLGKLKAGSRPEEIEGASARVAALEARIAELEQQVADAVVKSPTGGAVTEKLVERGEVVSRGTALAVVSDLDHPWLTVYVSEPDLGRIRLGQDVEVTTDAGQKRQGRVTFISSQAEFTPKNVQTPEERAKLVYRIKIGLPNPDGVFKAGMPAEARLQAAPTASASAQ